MRFPPPFLDEIRDRVPISEIVGSRVTFDRKKSNPSRGDHWACCPFHGEKTPSFHCEDRKGRYYCFGCGASGDHFRFLTEQGGMAFPEAVEYVANLAGVPMPERDPEAEKRAERRASLGDVMAIASRFFAEHLQAAEGAEARGYLRQRGLSGDTIARFGLGYAPPSRNALKEHLAAKGIDKERMEATGLLIHGPDIAVSYDRFRDRIMFPIHDAKGRIVSFGGRALSPDIPAKYLNGPETDLFHKGRTLYHLGPARDAARDAGTIVVVEGYMDVIALAQSGVANAVAPLGTALTEDQLRLLWRATPEPVLCFDGDEAGRRAAHRALENALPGLQAGRSLRFAALPGGRDPDDLVREEGRAAFDAVVAGARSLADTLWARETEGRILDTPERRAGLERSFRDSLRLINDEDVRRHYEQEMRERVLAAFGTARGADRGREGARGRGGRRYGERGGRERYDGRDSVRTGRIVASEGLARRLAPAPLAISPREGTLMALIVNHPAIVAREYEAVADLEWTAPDLRRLHSALLDVFADGEPGDVEAVAASLREAGHGDTLDRINAAARARGDWTALPDAAHEDAHDCFDQLVHLQQRAIGLERELRELSHAAETDLTESNWARIIELKREVEMVANVEAVLEGYGKASGRRATGG